ncbi:MAG: ribosome biogenesis GTP-binding protein YihA/YsxC [Pseudomonadota bacterium]
MTDTSPDTRLFSGPVTFLKGAVAIAGLPSDDLPEIAFAGRSNVGKSSLINALFHRKTLARTSNTPGRTQELNFFAVGPQEDPIFRLVDMPGYGYAEAPKKKVGTWTGLIHAYLRGRSNLKRVYLLIDARHGVKATDTPILDTLDASAVSYHVVATKLDKVKPDAREAQIERISDAVAKRPAAYPGIIATSSVSGDGLDDLRAAILTAVS